jgi:lipopolysaccharide/colanic/teichoic acid biosynthesis glycosyltransferase
MSRVLDVLISFTLLVVMTPVFILIALAVKLSDGGPVFFVQDRVGLNGKLFRFYKFRSMVVNADYMKVFISDLNKHGSGITFKVQDDPRITPIGRFLRKTSLDELPQLYNVLRGDMALVGPRPAVESEVMNYSPDAMRRLSVKPGLTCYWQIMGRAELDFEKQLELDMKYIREKSLMTDFFILLKTPLAVIRGKGAY